MGAIAELGKDARLIPAVEDIVRNLGAGSATATVVVLSNGGFGGIHEKLLRALEDEAPRP